MLCLAYPKEEFILVAKLRIADAEQIEFELRADDGEPVRRGDLFSGGKEQAAPDEEVAWGVKLLLEGRHVALNGPSRLWQGQAKMFVASHTSSWETVCCLS